jgi:hypothetical protein
LPVKPGRQGSFAKAIAIIGQLQSIKQVLLSLDARIADRQESHLPSFPTLGHDRQFCSVEPKLGLSFL